MKKKILIVSIFIFVIIPANAQNDSLVQKNKKKVYNYNTWVDLPITIGGAGLTLFNFSQIYNKKSSSEAGIMALDPKDVNRFDRGVAGNYDEESERMSDMIFYGSIPLPLIVFALDPDIRKDYLQVSALYVEAMSVTGVMYTTSQQLNNRRRPYTYNTDLDLSVRTQGSGKNSFMSGHAALVGTATFLMAKVYDDYHPDSGFKWVLYAIAGASTYATAHLRVNAGQHFPTDAIVGSIIGMGNGFLIPHLHKNKDNTEKKLSVLPVTGEYHGLRVSYTF